MLSGLMLTAFLMGVGGMPHCATMCGAPCAAAFPKGVPIGSLLGRCLAYALLGAGAALGAGAVAGWGREIAFLRPFWVLLLAATMLLGLYLLARGRMPRRVDEWGMDLYHRARSQWRRAEDSVPQALRPWLPVLGGMVWVVMPCGLLYAALMVAALAPTAWGGALVMFAFAVPGAAGVWAAPVVIRGLRRLPSRHASLRTAGATDAAPAGASPLQVVPVTWMRRHGGEASLGGRDGPPGRAQDVSPLRSDELDDPRFDPRWAVRLSGALLAAMAGWALFHQLWAQWQAWCA